MHLTEDEYEKLMRRRLGGEPNESVAMPVVSASGLKTGEHRRVLEDKFYTNWRLLSGPPLTREVRFDLARQWRFDFAHLPTQVAIEINGGTYMLQGGHNWGSHMAADYAKYNRAVALGWRLFFFSGDMLYANCIAANLEQVIQFIRDQGATWQVGEI